MKVFIFMIMFAVIVSTALSSPHRNGQDSSEEIADPSTDAVSAIGASAQQGSKPSKRNRTRQGGGSDEANEQSERKNNNDASIRQSNNQDYTNPEDVALLQKANAQKSQASRKQKQIKQKGQGRNTKLPQSTNPQRQKKNGANKNANKRRSTTPAPEF